MQCNAVFNRDMYEVQATQGRSVGEGTGRGAELMEESAEKIPQ